MWKRLPKAVKLAAAARAAAEVRAFDTNPDVVAYRIERTRAWVDRLIWSGLVMGLAFTATNVQAFAAQGEDRGTAMWVVAWLLDPMVSLVLIGVLLGEQAAARYGLRVGGWVRATKWIALILTYAMNTWSSWDAGDPAKILLHSVPVVIVFCAAEAVTDLRHLITRTVQSAVRAMGAARTAVAEPARTDAPAPVGAARTEPVREPARTVETARTPAPYDDRTTLLRTDPPARTEPVRQVDRTDEPARTVEPRTPARTAPARTDNPGRTEARATVPAPRTDEPRTEEPVYTNAPPRERPVRWGDLVKDRMPEGDAGDRPKVDRDVFVMQLASQIITQGDAWKPDYDALMAESGYGKSWCEKAVRDARKAALQPAPADGTDGSE